MRRIAWRRDTRLSSQTTYTGREPGPSAPGGVEAALCSAGAAYARNLRSASGLTLPPVNPDLDLRRAPSPSSNATPVPNETSLPLKTGRGFSSKPNADEKNGHPAIAATSRCIEIGPHDGAVTWRSPDPTGAASGFEVAPACLFFGGLYLQREKNCVVAPCSCRRPLFYDPAGAGSLPGKRQTQSGRGALLVLPTAPPSSRPLRPIE